jgi:hypothetical protein
MSKAWGKLDDPTIRHPQTTHEVSGGTEPQHKTKTKVYW